MKMRVNLPTEGHRELDVEGTYADVLRAVDLSPQEASVLVDGRPVPADRPIDSTEVTVLRLVAGG